MLFAQRTHRLVRLLNSPSYKNCRCYSDTTRLVSKRDKIKSGPGLKEFIAGNAEPVLLDRPHIPYLPDNIDTTEKRKVFFDVYGCQMNLNDTEIVWSILKKEGFEKTEIEDEADIFLVMTCAIREGAENKIWHRLDHLRGYKRRRGNKHRPVKIGILGCMAERLKTKLIEKEKAVDIVAGPDSYRDLPRLLALTNSGQTAVNVLLSLDETYADVVPVRLNEDSVSAFISIMRGCDNMCTYCIVPFTRGRERSRPVTSIVGEVRQLAEQGVREVTLLGQNVNSYRDVSQQTEKVDTQLARGFKTVYKSKKGGLRFADLLDQVASVDPEMRIRFTAAHPKDFPDEVLQVIASHTNVCKMLHVPAQSGSSAVLQRMRRGYSREAYLELIQHVQDSIPGASRPDVCKMLHVPAQSGSSAVLQRMRRGYSREAYLELIQHVQDSIPGASRPDVCKMLHVPAQSGSSAVLQRMRRGYSREAYLELIQHVQDSIPGASRPDVCKMLHVPAQSGSSAVLQRMRRGYSREAYLELIQHVQDSIPGASRPNVCKMLHVPAQSGSSAVLQRMRRGYSREAYLELIQHVQDSIPGVGLSTDMICGFCGETEEEFQQTLSLMEIVDYNMAFLFPYSMREKTTAFHRYKDDVPEDVKRDRHNRMVQLYRRKCQLLNEKEIGNTHLVLVEGTVQKTGQLVGRNEFYLKVVFDQSEILTEDNGHRLIKPGDYVAVRITGAKSSVLSGVPLFHTSIKEFYREVGWADRNTVRL